MTCQHAGPLLNALADRELSFWQAVRVRRHLAACAACATELAAIQRLDAEVHAWRDVPAPSTLGLRIAAVLPPAVSKPARRSFPVRPSAVGLAGAATVVAAIALFLLGQPGQPTIAYADVVKAMASVKTATWTQELTVYNANGKLRVHQIQHVWIRRNPPAIATITFPDAQHPYKRQTLEDARGILTLRPNGSYVLRANKHAVFTDVQENLGVFGAALSPTMKSTMGLDGSVAKTTLRDGQPVQKVTQVFHYQLTPQVTAESHSIIWIDEKTKRCMKLELQTSHNRKLWMIVATDHVQYDQAPTPAIFDWSPPKGATVTKF